MQAFFRIFCFIKKVRFYGEFSSIDNDRLQ